MIAPSRCNSFRRFIIPSLFFEIEISSGLIRKQDRRLASQCAGHRYAPVLAAGKLCGIVIHPACHAHPVEHFSHAPSAFFHGHIVIREWQLDIFETRCGLWKSTRFTFL
jgi:hypothetical protein